jgi:hypothetical protein
LYIAVVVDCDDNGFVEIFCFADNFAFKFEFYARCDFRFIKMLKVFLEAEEFLFIFNDFFLIEVFEDFCW